MASYIFTAVPVTALSDLRVRARTAVGFAMSMLLLGCGVEQPPRSAILITIDTLRADHLSQAGYPRLTTPTLDALASTGTRFAWALSPASCTVPAHASMMLGVYPSFHGGGLWNGRNPLTQSETTLAELFSQHGLRTAAVVSNIVLRRKIGLDQGFETYDDALLDYEPVRNTRERRANDAVDRALEILEPFGDEPFFFWLHLQDPHGPYTPPASFPRPALREGSTAIPDATILRSGLDHSGFEAIPRYQIVDQDRQVEDYLARYEREIGFMDRELGRFLEATRARGQLDETLLVVVADHGEAFGENGYWFGHSHSVEIDQIHVPLIFAGPGIRAGAVVSEPASSLSVFATLLDLFGIEAPAGTQSQSLKQALRGGRVAEGPIFTESVPQRGVALGGAYLSSDRRPAGDTEFWKRNPTTGGYFAPLGTDAIELDPRRPASPDTRALLEKELRRFSLRAEAAIAQRQSDAAPKPPTEKEREMLEQLGYAN